MPSRSTVYNPDAPINAEQRKKNAEAAGQRGGQHADAVRSFSPWELDELRMDLLLLPTERAARFITLIDEHEAAQDFRQHVSAALDGAGLESLAEAITEAEDSLKPSNVSEKIKEILDDNPKATPAELVVFFTEFYDEQIDDIHKDITDSFRKLHDAVESSREALRVLDGDV